MNQRAGEDARRRIPAISVIIPTLNEAKVLPGTLRELEDVPCVEVIVADGGSTDGTPAIARAHRATVISCPPGKAGQMNRGAEIAKGKVLLFLHADTILPEGFVRMIQRALSKGGVAGGAFELSIDSPSRWLRVIERLASFRSRCLQTPYGDQGIFVRAEVFREMGGFKELPIMEDFEFVRQLSRRGRLAILPASVTTSARRWRARGILRTTFINQALIAGYCLGLSPERLARWYRREP